MGIHVESNAAGPQVDNSQSVSVERQNPEEESNVTVTTDANSEGVNAGNEYKPSVPEPEADLTEERAVDAEADLEASRATEGGGVDPTAHRERAREGIANLPEEEQEQWNELLDIIEEIENLGAGLPRDLQSYLTLLVTLLVLLVEVSSEMKKSQRDASYASMKLSVEHLHSQADKIKEGATIKMATAITSSAFSIAGNAYGINMVRVRPAGAGAHEASLYAQGISAVGGIVGSVGDYKNSTLDAEGRVEQSESQKDSYDSDQFKDTGNTTRELISSALGTIKEMINAYRSALDHAAGNIV